MPERRLSVLTLVDLNPDDDPEMMLEDLLQTMNERLGYWGVGPVDSAVLGQVMEREYP